MKQVIEVDTPDVYKVVKGFSTRSYIADNDRLVSDISLAKIFTGVTPAKVHLQHNANVYINPLIIPVEVRKVKNDDN